KEETESENSEFEQLKQVKEEKITIVTKLKNNFLVKFSSSPLFQLVFAWSWAYWFVYFFTCWGNPATLLFKTSPFSAVPLTWGLLTLFGPILYLVYQEYATYKSRLISDETQLTREQQDELSQIDNENEKIKRRTEMLEAKEKEAVQFRWGWGVIALIAG